MTEARATPSAKGTASVPADSITALLGVVALVGGVATGLFSDLRTPGKVIGFVAFVGWVLAWASCSGRRSRKTRRGEHVAGGSARSPSS